MGGAPQRAEPKSWQPVDSLLVVGEMFWMLQGSSVDEGFERLQLRECVGEAFDWLEPRGGHWDAALDASVLKPEQTPPRPEMIDLRRAEPVTVYPPVSRVEVPEFLADSANAEHPEPLVGSNNWAVTGARSLTGDAMLANDMHLGLSVPAIWFRAQFEIGSGAGAIRAEVPAGARDAQAHPGCAVGGLGDAVDRGLRL